MANLGEALSVQRALIEKVLVPAGWTYVPGKDLARAEEQVFVEPDLVAALTRLNPAIADDAIAILEQRDHGNFHVDFDALMDAMILKCADQFESGAVADVCEPRIAMTAEVALIDAAVFCTIKHRSPALEFANAIRCLFRVQLRHSPVVHILAAAHCVREMDLPVVAIVVMAHRRSHPALCHYGMSFAKQRLADQRRSRAAG